MDILTTKEMLGNWVDADDSKHKLVFFSRDHYLEIENGKETGRHKYEITVELSVTYTVANLDLPPETITISGDEMTISDGNYAGTYKRTALYAPSPQELHVQGLRNDTPILGTWVSDADETKKRIYDHTTMNIWASPEQGFPSMRYTAQYESMVIKQSIVFKDETGENVTTIVIEDFDGNKLIFVDRESGVQHKIQRQLPTFDGLSDWNEVPETKFSNGWQKYTVGDLEDHRVIYLPATLANPLTVKLIPLTYASTATTPTPHTESESAMIADYGGISLIVIPLDDFDNPTQIYTISNHQSEADGSTTVSQDAYGTKDNGRLPSLDLTGDDSEYKNANVDIVVAASAAPSDGSASEDPPQTAYITLKTVNLNFS